MNEPYIKSSQLRAAKHNPVLHNEMTLQCVTNENDDNSLSGFHLFSEEQERTGREVVHSGDLTTPAPAGLLSPSAEESEHAVRSCVSTVPLPDMRFYLLMHMPAVRIKCYC